MSKEFANKSNEELCAIVARLKFQLLEARFRMATGEIEKVNVIRDVKKTIARILTELTLRGYKVTIGAHGISLYEIKTNKVKVITNDQLEKMNEKQDKLEQKKPSKKVKEAKISKPEVVEVKDKEVKEKITETSQLKEKQPKIEPKVVEVKEKTETDVKKPKIDMGLGFEVEGELTERGAALTSEIPLVEETENIEELEKK